MGSPPVTSFDDTFAAITALGLDTSVFIYFVASNERYVRRAREIFRRIDGGQFTSRTSIITLTEALTLPKRIADTVLERSYRLMLFESRHLQLLDVDAAIADRAADLRARHTLRTPDAIQIATALAAGCEAFLTNDRDLRRVDARRILTLDELTLDQARRERDTPIGVTMQVRG